jgi:integrase/recombinase XerD
MAQAASLQPGQIRHLLRVTAATSRHPERDTLVLLLGLTAGMRVTEIAQIEVQDVLFPSGALREEISLRAAITKGCRQRCIYLSHAKAIDAIDQYLERLTKPCDIPPTDERAGKPQERLVHVCSPLMPNSQSAEAVYVSLQ